MLTLPRPANLADASTREFCADLVAGGSAVALVAVPPSGAAQDDCTTLVNNAVAEHGGERLDGWAIWEHPGVMIEAEYHCVWKQPDGTLRDLSPLAPGIAARLWLHDPQLKYDDRQINNRRRNLANHPAVDRWIAAQNAKFEMLNKRERAYQHGEVAIPKSESAPVFQELLDAEMEQIGRNDPCHCGSGKKYKHCHLRQK